MSDKTFSQQLDLQSQRLGVIADRTLRTEHQLERITRELGTLKTILRHLEGRLDQ